MITVIPWESYTWKSHHKECLKRAKAAKEALDRADADVGRTARELKRAQDMGVENDPLPEDYGVRLLSVREGMVCPVGPAEGTD